MCREECRAASDGPPGRGAGMAEGAGSKARSGRSG